VIGDLRSVATFRQPRNAGHPAVALIEQLSFRWTNSYNHETVKSYEEGTPPKG